MIAYAPSYPRNPGYRKRGIVYTALIAVLASTMLGATSAFPVHLPPMSEHQKLSGSDTNTTNTTSIPGYEQYNANYDKYDPASVNQQLEFRGIKMKKVASRLTMKLMNPKRKTMGFAYLDVKPFDLQLESTDAVLLDGILDLGHLVLPAWNLHWSGDFMYLLKYSDLSDQNPENYWICVVTLEEDTPLEIRPYWNGRKNWNLRGKGPRIPRTYATFWDEIPNFPNVVVLEFPKKPFVESWVMDAECYADNKLLHKEDYQELNVKERPPVTIILCLRVSFTFNGVGVEVLGGVNSLERSPTSVHQLDDLPSSVFTFSANGIDDYRVPFYRSPTLESENHTLVMVVPSTSGSSDQLRLDYLAYT
ncbi:hypothetical protein F5876DRAFT_80514 [Lentinula aff. lateritia]|uniref:Uncharacterized protein n=1 Tax=Lentinula aff. lateritia TaxID=2804960 RepID=A0ACC1TPW1_9AGAR|nr:hypothetical protein F5876DRAFT_80514 [Lentinula aff. lateritia]